MPDIEICLGVIFTTPLALNKHYTIVVSLVCISLLLSNFISFWAIWKYGSYYWKFCKVEMSTFGLACLDLHTLNPEMISMLNMAKKKCFVTFSTNRRSIISCLGSCFHIKNRPLPRNTKIALRLPTLMHLLQKWRNRNSLVASLACFLNLYYSIRYLCFVLLRI